VVTITALARQDKNMIPKITENTVTTYILEGLKKKGIGAESFVSVETPEGRREVDVYCKNGGTYIVEAKFKESDLWKAAGKIQNDYIKYNKVLGISGGFAVLYPDVLAQPMLPVPQEILRRAKNLKFKAIAIYLPEDTRKNFTIFEGGLDTLIGELAKQILAPPEFIEPNLGFIIDTLRDAASAITISLRHLTGKEIEELFGGEHVFKNILAYEEGKYPVEDLRLASAYLLINQILFYHILSKKLKIEDEEKKLDELDPKKLTSPSDLKVYFEKVLDINYRVIFAFDVVSRIPKSYTSEIATVIGTIQSLGVQKVGGDLLGTIFHNLIPFELRKKVAAFYTDVMAAELLADLAIDVADWKVADFASGSGGLLVAAYKRKKDRLMLKGEFTEADHKRFVEQDLLGVDVMPFAANVAACNLALQSPEYTTNKLKVAIWDSTDLAPKKVIPSLAHLKFVLTGQQNLVPYQETEKKYKGIAKIGKEQSEDIRLEYYDAVIMNPPFTRQERIPKEYKNHLVDRFEKYSEYLRGQMSYYAYFILLADKFLKPYGKMALVLPASFLRTQSTDGIRKMLIEKYRICYIITRIGQLNFSDATWKREILFVATKKEENEEKISRKTKFVAIPSLPSTSSEAKKMSMEIKRLDEGEESELGIAYQFVDSDDLKRDLDWFRFITSFQGEEDAWEAVLSVFNKLESFGSIYDLPSVIKRGIETRGDVPVQPFLVPRNENRAIRKEDVWIASSENEKGLTVQNKEVPSLKITIPPTRYKKGLRTTAGNTQMNLYDETDYVVTGNFSDSERFFFGERKLLIEELPNFKKYVTERMGNIIIQRRFPIKAPGTIHLCYYSPVPVTSIGTTWVGNLPEDDAKILCLWFNSSFHLVQLLSERIEDVWLDVHKYKLQDLLVLNPKKLNAETRKRLVKTFNSLESTIFPSLVLQYEGQLEEKRKMDEAILRAFDVDEKTGEKLLTTIYASIKAYFESLKSIEGKEETED
jgi:hypothetical protein